MLPAITLAALVTAQTFQQLPLPLACVDAVQTSPTVLEAKERVHEYRALLLGTRAGLAPQLQVNYAQIPQAGPGNTTVAQQLATVGGGVTLGDFFTYAPTVQQAEAALQVAQSDALAVERDERLKVTVLYFTALRAIAVEQLRSQLLLQTTASERIAQNRFTGGDVPRLDVMRAQVTSAQALADLDQARADRMNALDALSLETNVPASSLQSLRMGGIESQENLPTNFQQAVTVALHTREELASAQASLVEETAAVQIVSRGALPTIAISAGYTEGIDSGVHVHGPSANLTASLPLSRASGYRIEAERSRLAQAEERLEGTRRQIILEVGSAFRSFLAGKDATRAAARAREVADAEFVATQVGYRNGASSSLDVTEARRTYVEAAIDDLEAIYTQAQSAAILREEIGL